MIQNYSDPIVTLNQVYKASEEGSQPVLGACIIGPHYIIRSQEDLGERLRIGTGGYTGTALSGTLPVFTGRLGGTVDQNSVKVKVKDAILKYASYSNGITLEGSNLAIAGVYFESTASMDASKPFATGDFVHIFWGENDSNSASCEIVTLTGNSCQLSGVPSQHGTITKVYFCKEQDCYVKAANVTKSGNTVTVTANAESSDSFSILGGKCYVEFREFCKAYSDKYGEIASLDYVEELLGKISPDNPLGIAVANALEEANGNYVYFIGLDKDTSNSASLAVQYKKAFDLIAGIDGIHGIVPCTDSPAVTKALLEEVEQESAKDIPYFKYLYASKDVPVKVSGQTATDITEDLVTWKKNINVANKRCSFVIADGAIYNSTIPVKNFCVAAALAGMRSAVEPHAPLSNVTLKAITTSDKTGFTRSQSERLGSYGFWRVGMREDGECISRRQLTSVASGDVNYDEQSIVCNMDSIGLALKVTGRNIVGNSNISPILLNILQTMLQTKLSQFMTYTDDFIGPQLLSGSVISIGQDAVYKDRIYAYLDGQPPKPFNRFHITFYMR